VEGPRDGEEPFHPVTHLPPSLQASVIAPMRGTPARLKSRFTALRHTPSPAHFDRLDVHSTCYPLRPRGWARSLSEAPSAHSDPPSRAPKDKQNLLPRSQKTPTDYLGPHPLSPTTSICTTTSRRDIHLHFLLPIPSYSLETPNKKSQHAVYDAFSIYSLRIPQILPASSITASRSRIRFMHVAAAYRLR
jgi:hypothetical protein